MKYLLGIFSKMFLCLLPIWFLTAGIVDSLPNSLQLLNSGCEFRYEVPPSDKIFQDIRTTIDGATFVTAHGHCLKDTTCLGFEVVVNPCEGRPCRKNATSAEGFNELMTKRSSEPGQISVTLLHLQSILQSFTHSEALSRVARILPRSWATVQRPRG